MSEKDGGPAFPVNELDQVSGYIRTQYLGASLRDLFAGLAAMGIRSSDIPGSHHIAVNAAREAYELADAMIVERAKEPPR